MPISAAPHVRRPYVGDRLIRLSQLNSEMARAQSRHALEQGQRTAQQWQQAGQAISQGLGAIREERELVPLRQAAAAKMAREAEMQRRSDEEYTEGRQAKTRDAELLADLNAFTEEHLSKGQRPTAEDIVRRFGPTRAVQINQVFDELFPKPKEEDSYTLNPGDVRYKGSQPVATNPKSAEPPKYTSPMRMADGTYQQFVEGQIPAGAKFYQEPKARPAEKAKFWVMRDGNPIRISENEYRMGDQPASNHEQGRPVTSGDAGRFTDLDTSLDDVAVLRGSISGDGSTGTMAAIGAAMPNFATEWFGWGADAKAKQAMIDRVKQVIGKALEEGVLRKEDEEKYKKILPTINDPNSLVLSKLQGLDDAIRARRQRHLDNLTAAGYETSKFGEYKPLNKGMSAVPDLAGLPKGRGRKFTSGPFAGQTWAIDDKGQPYKVGG